MAAQDDLLKQILGQGNTSKWSGGYGTDASAKDMAKLLADAGITDIKQFGKITQYEPVELINTLYNGQQVRTQTDEDGKTSSFIYEPTGKMLTGSYGADGGGDYTYPETRMVAVPKDAKLEKVYGVARDGGDYGTSYDPVDPSKIKTVDGKLVGDAGKTTFGNKLTGQAVENKYETGSDAFGGTYEGKGNTGYRVKFGDDGTPYFYTTAASSSDLGQIAPLLSIASLVPALAPFAQGLNALIAAKQGNILGAVAGAAGLGGMNEISNAAKFAGALKSGDPLAIAMAGASAGGVSDVGGFDLKDISKGIGAVKAIQSGDPLAMLRYGMGAMPKDGGLTSSLGPGTPEEFSEGLIPGYFQPGGEGYIAPTEEAPTGPGYYDEETGKFIQDENGGLQGPLGPETGNIDPNQKWEYDLVRPGVWANKDGEEIDVSYMPDRDVAQTGGDIMRRAGAMPGGSKAPAKTAAPAKPIAPTKPGAPTPTGTAPTTPATPNAPQQTSNADLLNLLGSKPELANIKSFKELFGDSLFGDSYVPPSAGGQQAGAEPQAELGMASQSEGEEQLFTGGHVDDFDVDALLRILRS